MDKELSIIDGILLNLAGILRFYEFERSQHITVLRLLEQFQSETCAEEELKSSNDIFKKETNKEINLMQEKINKLEEKIDQIREEISSRSNSKEKLVSLFNALKSVDSFDDDSRPKNIPQYEALAEKEFPLDPNLPIMEIREELNDDNEIIRSAIKPYQSPETQLKALLDGKKQKLSFSDLESDKKLNDLVPQKPISVPTASEEANSVAKSGSDDKVDSENEKFLPFTIREEIDEDGNIIKSSMSRIPPMKPNDDEKPSQIKTDESSTASDETKEIEDDQLAELFEDMGFTIPKISEVITPEDSTGLKNEISNYLEEKANNTIIKVPLKDQSSSNDDIEIPPSYAISKEDLYTLELITDELNREETEDDDQLENFGETEDEEEYEEEEEDYDGDDNQELGDDDIQKRVFTNMFGAKGQNMFAQQIMKLRNKGDNSDSAVVIQEVKDVLDDPNLTEVIKETDDIDIKIAEQKKPRKSKSVTFNNVVDVKQVDDIWDDLRLSNVEAELRERKEGSSSSFFKRSREAIVEKHQNDDEGDHSAEPHKNVLMSDVVERQLVECAPSIEAVHQNNVFKTFDSIITKKNAPESEVNEDLVKISGKKGPSKFKLARVAEIGKRFQETHIPAETREQLQDAANLILMERNAKKSTESKSVLKTNLKSLLPTKVRASGNIASRKIEAPKDANPLPVNPQSLVDEDYEIVRRETSDGLFDDDEDMPEDEFIVPDNIEIHNGILSDTKEKSLSTPSQKQTLQEFFPNYSANQETSKTEVVDTTLDYKSISEDMDTMAKAYILGLYDDDMHTTGEVIEELEDFKRHNQIVEGRDSVHLHERVTEINNDGKLINVEEERPMVVSDIVENDMNEILEANSIPHDQLDIELNDETLTNEVALDYAKIRSNMIHKYKGGFRETEEEKEFVRPEGSEKVSRFKLARLGV
ncbi:hypothetical protein PMKS-003995 [Pichia membranifaciens]|uniref:DUF3835 domain-containing protein n=1 Tax=Pichia membranifaciens TaxID=4926 RepID=A0A1Q2YLW9_9ASCO|nr:hypothetical protein PMKS-003995 [Pichia membranifaciens]